MSKFVSGWYLMYTRPNHEKKVEIQLAQKELVSFLPLLKTYCVRNMRILSKEIPMFPCYIFIKLGQPADFYNSMNIDGYLRYVQFGKELPRISENIIQKLKLVTDKGSDIKILRDVPAIGKQEMIKKGPLAGLFCKVIRRNNGGKVFVHIALLNTIVAAVVSSSDF